MSTHTTIITRWEAGCYVAAIDGKDIATSPIGSYRAAKMAAAQVAGPSANAKEVKPYVFRLIAPHQPQTMKGADQ